MSTLYSEINAVLTVYKRPDLLEQQVLSVLDQSVEISKIFIWINGVDLDQGVQEKVKLLSDRLYFIKSDLNLGVWQRFFFCLNLNVEYVAIFDDDTVLPPDWFESCLTAISEFGINTLCGARGIIFKSSNSYIPFDEVDFLNHRSTKEVDLVGHAWFCSRRCLQNFGFLPVNWDVATFVSGEDLHFSSAVRLAGGRVLVPGVLRTAISDYTSPDFWRRKGADAVAISSDPKALALFNKSYRYYSSVAGLSVAEAKSGKRLSKAGVIDHLRSIPALRAIRKFLKSLW